MAAYHRCEQFWGWAGLVMKVFPAQQQLGDAAVSAVRSWSLLSLCLQVLLCPGDSSSDLRPQLSCVTTTGTRFSQSSTSVHQEEHLHFFLFGVYSSADIPWRSLPLSARSHHSLPFIHTASSQPHYRYWISKIGHIAAANGSSFSPPPSSPSPHPSLKSMQIQNKSQKAPSDPLMLCISVCPWGNPALTDCEADTWYKANGELWLTCNYYHSDRDWRRRKCCWTSVIPAPVGSRCLHFTVISPNGIQHSHNDLLYLCSYNPGHLNNMSTELGNPIEILNFYNRKK